MSGMIRESVRIANDPAQGRYDAHGIPSDTGNVFVLRLGPTAHVYAVFSEPLAPGQAAAMEFQNIDGDGILDSIVTAWIDGGRGPFGTDPLLRGQSQNVPDVGYPLIVFLSRQRAPGRVRVAGRNVSPAAVPVAASVLYIPGSGGG